MAARSLFFLLVVFVGPASCLFMKKYVFVNDSKTWPDALTFCRSNYVDMASIVNQDEYNSVNALNIPPKLWFWIGLNKDPNVMNFNQWSDGSLMEFTKWKSGEPNSPTQEHCVIIINYEFYDYYCNKPLSFLCYIYEPQIILVNELKTWFEALKHCRQSYTDLVSLDTLIDWVVVNNNSLVSQTVGVWTGLHFEDGKWFWVNNESYSNEFLMPICPARPWHCGARNTGGNYLEYKDCGEKMNFMCYHI